MFYRRRFLLFTAAVWLAAPGLLVSGDEPSLNEPNLTEAQKKEFLLKAKVIASKRIHTGITHPWQLTLSDGTQTYYAHFQSIDEHKTQMEFATGRTELNFKDTYHFNIAAYELAKLLALDDMVPMAVERKWEGNSGAIAWWITKKWMENERLQEGAHPPDPEAWNRQMYKVRVFDQLIYETDANLTNVLITADWKIWRVDFTRAFRLYHDLRDPKDLVMCDRHLLEKLRQLDYDEVLEKTKPHLNKSEVQGVMKRRDKIVAYFEKLIAQKGENAVLY